MATTQKIALDYQNHHNLTQANTELEALDVANLNQWLLYVTETTVTNNSDSNGTNALVLLVTDLGLQSNAIHAYALQHNLIASAIALQPEVRVTVQSTPEAVAGASQADVVKILSDPASTPVISDTINTNVVTTNTDVVIDRVIVTPTLSSPVTPTVTLTLTPELALGPQVVAASDINVRLGPGTEYTIAGALQQSETADITGKNTNGDWWEVTLVNGQDGWVYGPLVQTTGDTTSVAVAANIPLPPTPIPTSAEVPVAAPAPATETPPEAPAPEQAPPVDPNALPHFTLVSRRLWGKEENDGCIGKHLLRIHVLDASGARLNGVLLRGIYTGYDLVTGDQGKGDGIIEFDLHGSGEGFKVIRNNDGREATSDGAEGFTTRSLDIDQATLITAGYCTNDADCQTFYNSYGCQGHHSWEAIFQRNY